MVKIASRLVPSFLLLLFVLAVACESKPKFENCSGQPTCPPPVDEKAPADLQQFRADVSGKWKLIRTQTRDTIHKTAGEYRNLTRSLCIGYEGNALYMIENNAAACALCYELKKSDTGFRVEVDHSGSNAFCKQSFQSGDISVAGDSLVMLAVDSFVHKRMVYRRLNADGTLKSN